MIYSTTIIQNSKSIQKSKYRCDTTSMMYGRNLNLSGIRNRKYQKTRFGIHYLNRWL